MQILESIAPADVPKNDLIAPKGVWTALAHHAILEHEKGLVAVVRMETQEDYKRMRNGTADYFRKAGYRVSAQVADNGAEGGLRVYLVLHRRDE